MRLVTSFWVWFPRVVVRTYGILRSGFVARHIHVRRERFGEVIVDALDVSS